jgi:hypothetical protein
MSHQSHLHVSEPRWQATLNPAPLRLDRIAHLGTAGRLVDGEPNSRGLTIHEHERYVVLSAGEALELLELLRAHESTLQRMSEEDNEAIVAIQKAEAREALRDELERP